MVKTKQLQSKKTRVQPTMLLATVGFWVLLNSYFLDRYIQMIQVQSEWTAKAIVVTILSWIILTSFYASFHLMSFLFSLLVRRFGRKAKRDYTKTPHVAMLYLCMNDMKEKAIEACLSQDYLNYSLYILDDSTVNTECRRVNALKEIYGKRISIIRRKKRIGFKAGNINDALRNINTQHEYICIIDADEIIPSIFLRELVSIAEGNTHLGFVQASHHLYGDTHYGKLTGDSIDPHWNYFLPARNSFGFVYSYGHGVLIRTQALTAIGGFPEVVSEDIALSTKLREIGYRGYYAYDVASYEETPPSYQAFRRKNQKIVSGTLDFLSTFYPSFLQKTHIPLIEKLDLLIALSVIYLPIPFMCYLLFIYGIIPFIGDGGRVGTITLFEGASAHFFRNTIEMFGPLQKWDGQTFMFFTIFASLCYLIPNAIQSPRRVFLYVLRMGAIYLSICLQTTVVALKWAATRQAIFTPTGDRLQRDFVSFSQCVEFSIGLGMMAIGLLVGSLSLLAMGLSLVLVPILIRKDLKGRLTSLLTAFPVLITVAAIIGMPALLVVGAMGMFAGMTLAYH